MIAVIRLCSRGRAQEWRSLWYEWRYSDVIEYCCSLVEEQNTLFERLDEMDFEYIEQLQIQILLELLKRS